MRAADLERFDRRSVLWFRRLFGAALIANVATEVTAGVWRVHTGELYPWRHLPVFPLWPTWALALEWTVTASAGVALLLGVRTAIAARVAAIVTLASVIERYSNHGALLFLVSLYVSFAPPDLDAPSFEATAHPNLGLVRAQLVIVYVFSALNKIAHGFASGQSLVNLLGYSPGLAKAASLAVIAVELALPVVLLRSPRIGILGVVVLHLAFAATMPGLWSFALTMIAMAVLFLPPPPLPAPAGAMRG
jgi:hypothetical protein